MKKSLILTFAFICAVFVKAWSQDDKTQPTAKPTGPAKDKTEQMKKAEEKSDGAAFSGEGKGGEKDMIEKDKKDKKYKTKKDKKAKKSRKAKKAKKVKEGEQPETGAKENPGEQPKPQTEPAPATKPKPEAKKPAKTIPKTKENGNNKK